MKMRDGVRQGLTCVLGWLIAWCAHAFDVADLQRQLQNAPVVRGSFVQEKNLRGLDVPLRSTGTFTLAAGQGLLWHLTAPMTQTLRITPNGVAYWVDARDGKDSVRAYWQAAPQQGGRENRLFLSVLGGDTAALQQQFQLVLRGHAKDWQLTLTPISALLRQIFTQIEIAGGAQVARVTLHETQGDRTALYLSNVQPDAHLHDEETHAFAN